ncbi:MAG: hypothetical protein PVG79_08705 [Gemmatimonadales bacterium]|jgi:hypothetical protein
MRRLVKGMFGFVGAAIGWQLAAPVGQLAGVFAAIIGVALGVYVANRLFLHIYG